MARDASWRERSIARRNTRMSPGRLPVSGTSGTGRARCCSASATSATLFGQRRYKLSVLTPARAATWSIVSRA
jgi:hypothetical protein